MPFSAQVLTNITLSSYGDANCKSNIN